MVGWLGLAIYVCLYDLSAMLRGHQTLSGAFYEALDHPVRKWGVVAVWSILTLHLFHLIPDKYDPIRRIGAELWSVSKKNNGLAEVIPLHPSQWQPTPEAS